MFKINLEMIKQKMMITVLPTMQNIVDFIEKLEEEHSIKVPSDRYFKPDIFNILWSIYLIEQHTGLNILDVKYLIVSSDNYVNVQLGTIDIKIHEEFDDNFKTILLLSE